MIRLRGLSLPTILRLLRSTRRLPENGPLHCFLCVADHFEPEVGHAAMHVRRERVDRWLREYPESVAGVEDSRGRPPQHTFFFPAEAYHPEHLDKLARLCRQGYGDVEVHLHHDNDTAENLRQTLENFKTQLHGEHGLLGKNGDGQITYGFIHGNWALNNSRPDGRWCGVNNELTVLRETGCYADFTFPSAPSPTQPDTINSIYYAADDPPRPKAHDVGTRAQVGVQAPASGLLLIQGPLMFDWGRRKYGLPKLENGDLWQGFPPSMARFNLWLRAGVSVIGRPNWLFIKLHTHGAPEHNAAMLLGEPMRRFYRDLAEWSRQDPRRHYYYVTAREMADLVHQAERGIETPVFSQTGGFRTAPLTPSPSPARGEGSCETASNSTL